MRAITQAGNECGPSASSCSAVMSSLKRVSCSASHERSESSGSVSHASSWYGARWPSRTTAGVGTVKSTGPSSSAYSSSSAPVRSDGGVAVSPITWTSPARSSSITARTT